jgi:peroxiredoxin
MLRSGRPNQNNTTGKRACRVWVALLAMLAFGPVANAATLLWRGDSTTTIASVARQKALYLSLAQVALKLPITLRQDAEAGLFVLCTLADCRPVYGIDASELVIIDSTAYVRVDAVAEALDCAAKIRKRDQVELNCNPPAVRVGSQIGSVAPGFRLPDTHDSLVTLSGLLARGPLVVAFVRSGDWDPQSKKLLTELQARRDSLRGAGVDVVAIHGYETKLATKWMGALKLSFPQLADQHSAVMRGYDVFDKGNLPLPALFLIDRAGVIRLRQMLDPAEVNPNLAPLMEAVGRL